MSDSVRPVPDALKILVAGGFGAETTLVSRSAGGVAPHREVMTAESVGVDDLTVESRRRRPWRWTSVVSP